MVAAASLLEDKVSLAGDMQEAKVLKEASPYSEEKKWESLGQAAIWGIL